MTKSTNISRILNVVELFKFRQSVLKHFRSKLQKYFFAVNWILERRWTALLSFRKHSELRTEEKVFGQNSIPDFEFKTWQKILSRNEVILTGREHFKLPKFNCFAETHTTWYKLTGPFPNEVGVDIFYIFASQYKPLPQSLK